MPRESGRSDGLPRFSSAFPHHTPASADAWKKAFSNVPSELLSPAIRVLPCKSTEPAQKPFPGPGLFHKAPAIFHIKYALPSRPPAPDAPESEFRNVRTGRIVFCSEVPTKLSGKLQGIHAAPFKIQPHIHRRALQKSIIEQNPMSHKGQISGKLQKGRQNSFHRLCLIYLLL